MGELLAEITDKLPSREEMRKKRANTNRRSRKKSAKKSSRKKANDGEEKQSKRKKKSGDGGPQSRGQEKATGPVPEPSVPGGPTFTGKPSPEMLEKMKAERKARLAARKAKKEAEKSGEAPDTIKPKSSETIEPKSPETPENTPIVVSADEAESAGAKKKATKKKAKRKTKTKTTRAKKKPPVEESVPEDVALKPDPESAEKAVAKKPGLLDRLLGRGGESQDTQED